MSIRTLAISSVVAVISVVGVPACESGTLDRVSDEELMAGSPVVTVPSDGAAVDSPQVVFSGQLQVTGGCTYLRASSGGDILLVWPEGARWDSASMSVVAVDGQEYVVGDVVEVTGFVISQHELNEMVPDITDQCELGREDTLLLVEQEAPNNLLANGVDLTLLNNRVKQFITSYVDTHQLDLGPNSIGIDVGERKVTVVLSRDDRQRDDVKQMESELIVYVDSLLNGAEGSTSPNDVFIILEGEMLPPD